MQCTPLPGRLREPALNSSSRMNRKRRMREFCWSLEVSILKQGLPLWLGGPGEPIGPVAQYQFQPWPAAHGETSFRLVFLCGYSAMLSRVLGCSWHWLSLCMCNYCDLRLSLIISFVVCCPLSWCGCREMRRLRGGGLRLFAGKRGTSPWHFRETLKWASTGSFHYCGRVL